MTCVWPVRPSVAWSGRLRALVRRPCATSPPSRSFDVRNKSKRAITSSPNHSVSIPISSQSTISLCNKSGPFDGRRRHVVHQHQRRRRHQGRRGRCCCCRGQEAGGP